MTPKRTRESPTKSKKARASENQKYFRWTDPARFNLLKFLNENSHLYYDHSTSRKDRYNRILNELSDEDFPHKASMKWSHLENGMEWLEDKYKIQTARFKKTGEGPTAKEERAGARNLEGTLTVLSLLLTKSV
jgi:hypothetical protein